MTKIAIIRSTESLPEKSAMDAASRLLFGAIQGFTKEDRRAWSRFWKRITEMEPGEIANVEMVFPRSGPFHRRHMAIEQSVFDAQERFEDFEQFRIWVKVGAAWVDWCAGPKGGVVPIPRSISYTSADQEEFTRYHEAVIQFLRGPHAAPFLWRHLGEAGAAEMMGAILDGFNK